MPSRDGTNGAAGEADGFRMLRRLRQKQSADIQGPEIVTMEVDSEPSSAGPFLLSKTPMSAPAETLDSSPGPSSLSPDNALPADETAELQALRTKSALFLNDFLEERLSEPCILSLSEFFRLVSSEVINVEDVLHTDGLVKDLLITNLSSFLKCLQHANWRWVSLLATDELKSFVLKDVIPSSMSADCRVYLARIAVKLFALAVREEDSYLRQHFSLVLAELCKLEDCAPVLMWMLVDLLAFEEMTPYMAGGTCQICYYLPESDDLSVYDLNIKNLSAPSLLRFRPEPRPLRPKERNGISAYPVLKKMFKTVSVSPRQALENQTFALDALWFCCEKFPSKDVPGLLPIKLPPVEPVPVKPPAHDTPGSPGVQDVSPASPPPVSGGLTQGNLPILLTWCPNPVWKNHRNGLVGWAGELGSIPDAGDEGLEVDLRDATGLALESPASPDLPEMRTSKTVDETFAERYRMEVKDFVMKISTIPSPDTEARGEPKPKEFGTYSYLKKCLYSLGGWHWLAICLVDVLKPEESDRNIWWPEFQTVAFFNRNVHIVRNFSKNPLWMKLLEAASAQQDVFIYHSPIIRPVFISMYIHWETSFEQPSSARNKFALQQTAWILRCLSKAKMLHEPYCFFATILDVLAPIEISSVLASLWKVVKTYFPNPHGLLNIPEAEQDFRARQMAETDCLLKIRAIIFSHLPAVGVFAKKFFLPARVPLEESRWYESTQSQETASAPAPINATHLAKVD